jgi:transcriptional regulator of nitric oxide reductase
VLPSSLLHSEVFAVLAAFVAINTVMYAALALAKMLPKIYPSDWLQGSNRRARVRGIYPEQASGSREPHTALDHVA